MATRKGARATRVMLACRRCSVAGMACSGRVRARNAIGSVACRRVCILPWNGASLLVARCSTLAECREVVGLVDDLVPLSRHVAVRHPFRIPCVLRACRVPRLPLHIAAVRPFRSRRSAVRGGVNVDLRHDCLSRGWSDSQHTPALAAEFRSERNRYSEPGGSSLSISEPAMFAALPPYFSDLCSCKHRKIV